MLTFADAQKYIAQLNSENLAGYSDWRLPTLDEAMSLMEPEKMNNDLYIKPVFNDTQSCIWTVDKESAGVAWIVEFKIGFCFTISVNSNAYVRAVRLWQS